MRQPPVQRGSRPRHARPDPAPAADSRRSAELRSFDALWSDDHWEHRPDAESLRSWLGLSPTATLTDLPPIREELPRPRRELEWPREEPHRHREEPHRHREELQRHRNEPPLAGDDLLLADDEVPRTVAEPMRSLAPSRTGRGSRAVFALVFWALLGLSLALWWFGTPARSIGTAGDALLAAGQITGLAGGFVLLFQVLLMSRVSWLERWIGAHSVLVWHRELGGYLFFAVLTHIATTIVAYSQLSQRPLLTQGWEMVTGWEDMLSATAATAVLVGIVVISVRGVRRTMSYETWYYLHLSAYLVVVLAYAHQFSSGQQLGAGFGRWYWIGLHAFVLGNLIWGRLIGPLVLNVRHRLRILDVVEEAPGMVSLYISGRRLPDLKARAGQYFRWRFLSRGAWWQAHPFSLSAAPNHEWLRLTIKVVGDHTAALQRLRPGTRVVAEGPSGVFTADRSVKRSALLIAGGSGIAPIRALLEDLPSGTILIYRATTPADIVFRRELDWLAHERRAYVWYVIGRRDDPGPRQLFSPHGMHKLIPDVAERDVFLCGPPGLVAESVRTLRRLRVRRRQIHVDPFEF